MLKNKGLHTYRLKDNPEEKRFAEAWDRQDQLGRNLTRLLDERSPRTPTPRDVTVAATVIQWLGSPVGQCFLRDLGYERNEP
jgi:hypothetical protein